MKLMLTFGIAAALAVALVSQGAVPVEAAQKAQKRGSKTPAREAAGAQQYSAQQDSSAYLKKGKTKNVKANTKGKGAGLKAKDGGNAKSDQRGWKSRSGHQLTFD